MLTTINPMKTFVIECCEVRENLRVFTTEIWRAYNAWCEDGRNRPMSRTKMFGQLESQWPGVKRKKIDEKDAEGNRIQPYVFVGIALDKKGLEYAERGKAREHKLFGDG